jgi:hypothetical protein
MAERKPCGCGDGDPERLRMPLIGTFYPTQGCSRIVS